jgi:hypothetical protein
MALASFVPLCSAGIDDGLMAWWKLDGNALDSGPNGNNGTLHGGVTPTADHNGQEGRALQFDGVDGYISVPDSATLHSLNQRTVAMWFRSDPSPELNLPMLVQGNHNQGPDGCERTREFQLFFYPDPGSSGAQLISAGDGKCQNGLSGSVPQDHRWHHVVGVVDRLTSHSQTIYIDGKRVHVVKDPYSTFNTSSEELRIAWTVEGNGSRYKPFSGALDEVRLYNRVLSPTEVKELYESSFDLSGVTHGYTQFGVTCRNVTTGQQVTTAPTQLGWNCETAGLVSSPGDEIDIDISGTAH